MHAEPSPRSTGWEPLTYTEARVCAQGLLAVIDTESIFREYGVGLMSNQ